jgi:hypothetical protein
MRPAYLFRADAGGSNRPQIIGLADTIRAEWAQIGGRPPRLQNLGR